MDGIGLSFHKNVIVPVPQEAHDASYRQGQDNHNYQKDGHKFILHCIDLQMISNCEKS